MIECIHDFFFFSSRRRHTRWTGDWSSDVCSSDLATRVDFSLPRDDALEVTVWSGTDKMMTRTFSAAEGELACDAGRLILRNTHWTRADVMLAREKVKLTLHRAGDYLVAEVEDDLAGLFFVIVPIVGSVTNWYRFAKAP